MCNVHNRCWLSLVGRKTPGVDRSSDRYEWYAPKIFQETARKFRGFGSPSSFSQALFRSFTNLFHLLFNVDAGLVTGGGSSRKLSSILLRLR